jgi:chorismate dehydratase
VTPFAALHGLRVGCVQYLNAKPLIVPYDGEVSFQHPACLADMLAAGAIDVALVPVFEALRHPDFPIADGIAIASRGPVYSVVLAHCRPLEEIETVTLDPASRTSNNLTRVILEHFHGTKPAYEKSDAPAAGTRARIFIGNQAIRARETPTPGLQYLDLGEEWLKQTALPFVYAVWQFRPEVSGKPAAAHALRAIKSAGLQRVHEIAHLQRDFPPAFAEHYLTAHIKFDLDAEEKAGLALFRTLLQSQKLIPPFDTALTFI